MTASPTSVLPKRIPHGLHKPSLAIQVSPLLFEATGCEAEEVLQKLHTSKGGLSREEAERRLDEYGPNVVAREERHPRVHLLGKALINPLVILLLVLAASSFLTGDFRPAA
jgi:Mg2+-importing ATPase